MWNVERQRPFTKCSLPNLKDSALLSQGCGLSWSLDFSKCPGSFSNQSFGFSEDCGGRDLGDVINEVNIEHLKSNGEPLSSWFWDAGMEKGGMVRRAC